MFEIYLDENKIKLGQILALNVFGHHIELKKDESLIKSSVLYNQFHENRSIYPLNTKSHCCRFPPRRQ